MQGLLLTRAPPRTCSRLATDLLRFSILSLGNGSSPAVRTYIVRKISAAVACNLHFRSHTGPYNAPKTMTAAGTRSRRKAGRKRGPPANCPSLSSGVLNSTFGHRDDRWGGNLMPGAGARVCSVLEQSRARRRKFLNVAKWGSRGDFSAVSERGERSVSFSLVRRWCHRRIENDFSHLTERANLNDCFGLSNVLRRTCSVLCPSLCTRLLIARPGTSWAIFSSNETILGS